MALDITSLGTYISTKVVRRGDIVWKKYSVRGKSEIMAKHYLEYCRLFSDRERKQRLGDRLSSR